MFHIYVTLSKGYYSRAKTDHEPGNSNNCCYTQFLTIDRGLRFQMPDLSNQCSPMRDGSETMRLVMKAFHYADGRGMLLLSIWGMPSLIAAIPARFTAVKNRIDSPS